MSGRSGSGVSESGPQRVELDAGCGDQRDEQRGEVVEGDDVVGFLVALDWAEGIANDSEDAASVGRTVPPNRWTAVAPVAPSWPLPLSTTAIARGPAAVASVVRRRSAEGRLGGNAPDVMSAARRSPVVKRCRPGVEAARDGEALAPGRVVVAPAKSVPRRETAPARRGRFY